MQYINIDSFKRSVEFRAAKHQTGNSLTPNEFNNELPKYVNTFINACIGDARDYGVTRPGFRITDEIIHAVRDFIDHLKESRFLQIGTDGILTEPSDYMRFSSMRIPAFEVSKVLQEIAQQCGECHTSAQRMGLLLKTRVTEYWNPVEVCDDATVAIRLSSSFKFPTKEYPVGQKIGAGWQMYPADLRYVLLNYTRYPNKPVWGWTAPSGAEIYDASTSVNIELPFVCEDVLINYFLQAYGIHNQDQFVVQMSDKGKREP